MIEQETKILVSPSILKIATGNKELTSGPRLILG